MKLTGLVTLDMAGIVCHTQDMGIQLDGYTLPEHVSYSAFTTYVDCGYMYYLGRLLMKEESPSVWSVGGSAFHLACENYDKGLV